MRSPVSAQTAPFTGTRGKRAATCTSLGCRELREVVGVLFLPPAMVHSCARPAAGTFIRLGNLEASTGRRQSPLEPPNLSGIFLSHSFLPLKIGFPSLKRTSWGCIELLFQITLRNKFFQQIILSLPLTPFPLQGQDSLRSNPALKPGGWECESDHTLPKSLVFMPRGPPLWRLKDKDWTLLNGLPWKDPGVGEGPCSRGEQGGA